MPLTTFQKEVVRLLAANRNPDSHIAGGSVINRAESSLRFSEDIDIFHDVITTVAESAAIDERTLLQAGYGLDWYSSSPGFLRAGVRRESGFALLDWTTDSAFRFFPVQADVEFGYCLHRADLATNKMLALAGRSEIRDFLDILQLDGDYLSLGAMIWAACGKDQGLTPDLILQLTDRHSRFQESELQSESLARPVDLRQLKRQWIEARIRAAALFEALPSEHLGCLYLGAAGEPITPDPQSPEFSRLVRHFGTVRGAWPRIS